MEEFKKVGRGQWTEVGMDGMAGSMGGALSYTVPRHPVCRVDSGRAPKVGRLDGDWVNPHKLTGL